jgi:hypothetical protein
LSRSNRQSIDKQLESHGKEFACINQLLAEGKCEQPPACPVRR